MDEHLTEEMRLEMLLRLHENLLQADQFDEADEIYEELNTSLVMKTKRSE